MTNLATLPSIETTMQERIINLISWRLNVPSANIHPHTRLQDDLNLDAVDLLLLIAELESRFNAYLSPEEVEAIETVRDASFYFQKYAA